MDTPIIVTTTGETMRRKPYRTINGVAVVVKYEGLDEHGIRWTWEQKHITTDRGLHLRSPRHSFTRLS